MHPSLQCYTHKRFIASFTPSLLCFPQRWKKERNDNSRIHPRQRRLAQLVFALLSFARSSMHLFSLLAISEKRDQRR
jgi:hypothetical protein